MASAAELAVVAAFKRTVAGLHKTAGGWIAEADADAQFDIIGAVGGFSWGDAFEALREPLALILKDAVDKASAGVRAELDKSLVSNLAFEWAQFYSAQLVTGAGRTQKQAIREVIADGIQQNHTVQKIARDLRSAIGVSPRDMRALRKMRDALVKDGLKASVVSKRLQRRADIMVRRRALTIARTEVAAAITQGKLAEWGIAVSEGTLPDTMRRIWLARDPCRMCVALARHKPVPLSEPFVDINGRALFGPPAHPRCKCSVALVPASGGRPSFRKARPEEIGNLAISGAAGLPRGG